MVVGAYLCGSLTVAGLALVGLLAAIPEEARWGTVRLRLRQFALFSALFPTLGLAAFLILSGIAGLIRLAQPQVFNLPDDFIGAGPLGWVSLAVSYWESSRRRWRRYSPRVALDSGRRICSRRFVAAGFPPGRCAVSLRLPPTWAQLSAGARE